MENKYVSFEVYRPVKSPTEKGEYMGKTPNLEQARRAADAVGGALYGITSDGRRVLLLQGRNKMQVFTKIEIKWVIDELEAEMKQLKSLSAVETGAARSLYILRAEQLDVISGKLRTAIEAGDKRIEIKY